MQAKYIWLLLAVFQFSFIGNSETGTILPLDRNGKVSFEETFFFKDAKKDYLYEKARTYLNNFKKEGQKHPLVKAYYYSGKLETESSFLVYTNGLFTKQVHGEILYNITIMVDDDKLTYRFSDFRFNYYKRNRYGKYEPVHGKFKPLEDEKFAGMQNIWVNHKQKTKSLIDAHIHMLKNEYFKDKQLEIDAKLDKKQ